MPLTGHPAARLLSQTPDMVGDSAIVLSKPQLRLPPRRLLVGISTKLYFSLAQTATYATSLFPLAPLANSLNVTLFLAPSLLSLPSVSVLLSSLPASSPIHLAAQDSHWEDSGAFTGCVAPGDLASLGVRLVELGHAERRRWFGEENEMVARKAAAVVRNGMIPLVCIGEVEEGSVQDALGEVVGQVESILAVTSAGEEIVFAYEPVWAIGAEAPAKSEYVVDVVGALRRLCEDKGRGEDVRFLYGGSAGPGTWEKMSSAVDGLFLGRFAHDIGNLETVVKEVGGLAGGLSIPDDIRSHV